MAEKILKVTFEANEQDLDKFNKLLKEAGINAEKLTENVEKTSEASDDLSDTFNKVASAAKAFIAVAAVKEIFAIGVAASKAAAEVEGIESAFKNLGGSKLALEQLSQAVGGTQSKVTLLKLATTGLQKGIGFDTLNKTLALAAKQADATGGSFEDLSKVIINSIGKQSTKGLEAFGFNLKSIENNAKSLGFVPALLQEVGIKSEELGVINTATADGYTKLALAQEDLTLALGKFINSKGVTGVLNFWAELASRAVKSTDTFVNGLDLAGLTVEELTARQQRLKREFESVEKLRKLAPAGYLGSGIRETTKKQLQQLSEDLSAITNEFNVREAAAKTLADNEKRHADEEAANALFLQQEEARKKKEEADKKAADEELRRQQELATKLLNIRRQLARDVSTLNEEGITGTSKDIQDAAKDLTSELKDNKAFQIDQKLPNKLEKPEFFQEQDKRLSKESADIAKANKLAADQAERLADGFQNAAGAAAGIVSTVKQLNQQDVSSASAFGMILQALSPFLSLVNPALGAVAGAAGGVLQQFNEGGWVGGHGPDKDTVPALLTTGEHVTKRRHAQRSPLLLDAINSGELDDTIFKRLNMKQSITVDQDKVVEAIQSIPVTELYKSGSALYEHRSQVGKRNAGRHKRIAL